MSRLRIALQPAYLLVQRPYRESSELLECLSRDHGRIGLVARGVRGPRSRLRGTLAPFRPLLLSWTEAGELGTLTDAEPDGPARTYAGERIFHGWYVNELLLKLLHRHDPAPAVFAHYADALAGLEGEPLQAEAALRMFEKRLLDDLGYGLPLSAEFDAAAHYTLAGGEFLPRPAPGPETVAGASLRALQTDRLSTRAELDDARRLLRRALEPHVPHASLRTPRLLRELRATRRP